MNFGISGALPLVINTELPGDDYITLSSLVLSFFSESNTGIESPSESDNVGRFISFMSEAGAVIEKNGKNLKINGISCDGEFTIGENVPEEILHILIAGLLPRARKIVLSIETPAREKFADIFLKYIKKIGFDGETTVIPSNFVIFTGGKWKYSGNVFGVVNLWEFEILSTLFFSAGKDLNISYPAGTVTHYLKLLSAMGYKQVVSEVISKKDIEIEKRKAKLEGRASLNVRSFSFNGDKFSIWVPGDIKIASAITAASILVNKSDISIKGILWEQSRRGFFDALKRMKSSFGVTVKDSLKKMDSAEINVKWESLEGKHFISVQTEMFSGEVPLLCIVAALNKGETIISGSSNIPGLDRDKFNIISKGLENIGARVGEYADGIVIEGGKELKGNLIDASGSGDAALAFTVAGLAISGETNIFGYNHDKYPVKEFLEIIGKGYYNKNS